MSEDRPPAPSSNPSTDGVKETTEKLAGLVQWIAELIQKRNWFTLLLLTDVGLFFGFKPQGGILIEVFKRYFGLELPNWYADVFWAVLASLFLAAIAIAVKTMPRAGKLEVQEGGERKVIKGLRSFTAEDAEIFAKLQRNQSIQACLESLKAEEFRFGVLMGESGCGKTSFLQAGVLPKLNQTDSACLGIYVKFSDRDPIETVREVLLGGLQAAEPDVNPAELESADLPKLLSVAPQMAKKPVVLVLDQFEQFFVHQRQKRDRQPLIDILTRWYQAKSSAPLKVLVSIRADLLHELYELQQAMGYVLSRYDVFKLEKFEPEEATEVLRVIAETEGWEFDPKFVMQLTRQDLVTSAGKVSPVDLQILAETIRKQPDARRAFKEEAFRQMGGLEGLLNRYLEETLEILKLNNLYQAAIQVLLALIDREQNLRAGVLSLAELEERLKATARPQEVRLATSWLASGEVRLITAVEQQGVTGYELAHERLIPAVVRLAGQELKAAERANQLLERRVNEWLGNGRSRRYLLSWRELWLLRQQKAYLVWGAKRREKEKLLRLSWQRWHRLGWAIVVSLMILLAGFLVWLSPPGQRWQMQWQLAGLRQRVSDASRYESAVALAKAGNQQQAFNVVHFINNPTDKAFALIAIAETYSKLNDLEAAKALLEQAYTSVEQIDDPYSKALALRAIAYSKLDTPNSINALLEEVRTHAEQDLYVYANPYTKTYTLSAIAEVYIKLDDPETAKALLEQADNTAEQFDNPDDRPSLRAQALSTVAQVYSMLDDPEAVKAALEQLRISVEQIDYLYSKADALIAIAEAYIELDDPETARVLLEQLRISVEQTYDPYARAYVLSAIAQAYTLEDLETSRVLLEQARFNAEQIDDPSSRTDALNRITQTYHALNDPETTKTLLGQTRSSADQIDDPYYKVRVLSTIAQTYSTLDDPEAAKAVLEQARTNAEQINDPSAKADTLIAIARTRAELGNWRQVNRTAALCTSNDCKAQVLSAGLTVWAEQQHPELKEEEDR